jgi:ABC-type branched-subunit amino acid transport system substrate-binding protein
MGILFNYYNERGGFEDSTGHTRKINFVTKDDGYDPARAIPLVDELLDSEKVFAIGSIGTPIQVKIQDKINSRCVPYLAVSNDYSTGDPVGHPWTASSSLSYTSEAIVLAKYLEQHLDSDYGGHAKLAVLLADTDLGVAYDVGFRSFIDSSPRKADIEYFTEKVASAAPVNDALTNLAARDPDIVVLAGAGVMCSQAATVIAENGMKEAVKTLMAGFACKTIISSAGLADGWLSTGGGMWDVRTEGAENDAWNVFVSKLLSDNGFDWRNSDQTNNGLFYGWYVPQALMVAGQLPGGLTRTNLITALRAMDMTHPNLLPGVQFNMDGNRDAFLVEGSDISHWDSAKHVWVVDSVVDFSGSTKPCNWDPTTQHCS